ncbi:hypothetical protein [Longitalea arenae]|uniref:hypothetical protein n=1 Tax=Longitalea arenae TaxID=2812558 RepID=UPI001967B287|nr:hypothetical protein [Longitalea arenae]
MKHLIPGVLIFISASTLQAQTRHSLPDSARVPGDNFSLQGALELFKKAASPEEFEKLLNTEDSKVNNLDLNEDGNTDYIRVVSKRENEVQIFVLQALVSENENQDIAVIELEKTGSENAVIDIVGDEDIFGEEIIVEPDDSRDHAYIQNNSRLGSGPDTDNTALGIVVNVWAWPCVRYVYAPSYVVWVSPFSWRTRPVSYRPWRPLAWHVYRPVRYRYRPHYAVVSTRRVIVAPRIYQPMRVSSVTVRTRHQVAVNNYRVTKKTTTVHGPRGRKYSRTTTTVRRRHR